MKRVELIFVGRSNVGKSTMIRELFNIKTTVGRRPGVTLKPTQYLLNNLIVTDMPGYGFMSGIEGYKRIQDEIVRYIETYYERILTAVQVVDANSFVEIAERHELSVDRQLFEFLLELDIDTIFAINKLDKIKNPERELNEIVAKLGMLPPYKQWIDRVAPVCAKKGDVRALKILITNRFKCAHADAALKYLK